jgi:hypothetical protein
MMILKLQSALSYPVVQPFMRSRGHLGNVQYGGLEGPGCLPYPIMRSSVWSRDHLKT